jgi:hypothetical protein
MKPIHALSVPGQNRQPSIVVDALRVIGINGQLKRVYSRPLDVLPAIVAGNVAIFDVHRRSVTRIMVAPAVGRARMRFN